MNIFQFIKNVFLRKLKLIKETNKIINIGIIGISDGNGHPYSWSAIINGYNKNYIDNCPYPIIIDYLKKNNPPSKNFQNFKITHIWTQDINISKNIALIGNIPNIVTHYNDLIGNVDAVILARDDFENHLSISKEFLKSGIPIFIDKPIATNLKDLNEIYKYENYSGQIFSCSAMRNLNKVKELKNSLSEFGEIKKVVSSMEKSWQLYSIHIIELTLSLLSLFREFESISKFKEDDKCSVTVGWENGPEVIFITKGQEPSPCTIEIQGTKKTQKIIFEDYYDAFENTLVSFCDSIRDKKIVTKKEELNLIVKIIEFGSN